MSFRGTQEKEAVKQLENNEKSGNTQENGLLQQENTPPPPSDECKLEDTTTAQPEAREATPDSGNVLLLENVSTAHREDAVASDTKLEPHEEDPASVREKAPQGISPPSKADCPESPPRPETNTSTEHITASISPADVKEGCCKDARPSGELTQNNEALSAPKSELTAAAGQAASSSEVALETNPEASSW